ncbi:MAG: ABC transporter substrate-binding protein [bacterium]
MRTIAVGLASAVLLLLAVAALAADAQPAGKVYRIGVLAPASPGASTDLIEAFRDGLQELGYVDGRNITIEWRWAHGKVERLPELAAELVRLKVDLIVGRNNDAVKAAQEATRTIPIVMVFATDPVALGFVASLARPGGNVTGLSSQTSELAGKRLQLLREAVPKLSRLAILWDPMMPGFTDLAREYELGARTLRMEPRLLEVRNAGDLDRAFAVMTRDGVDAVFAQGTNFMIAHRAQIATLAVKNRLPMMCSTAIFVEDGCLMSYFARLRDLYRSGAVFVDKILKGAKPADLPVEQPRVFELVINLKTAMALGLTIPLSLLLRADKIIQS